MQSDSEDLFNMQDHSFQFGDKNSFEDFGIKILRYDILKPQKRNQSITIPNRSGNIELNTKRFYESRKLDIKCVCCRDLTRNELRQLAYYLNKRNIKITFWDEEDKYYLGEIFDPPSFSKDEYKIRFAFTLSFICNPFAYGKLVRKRLYVGNNNIEYNGTFQTPTLITIRNNGNIDINNLMITEIRNR